MPVSLLGWLLLQPGALGRQSPSLASRGTAPASRPGGRKPDTSETPGALFTAPRGLSVNPSQLGQAAPRFLRALGLDRSSAPNTLAYIVPRQCPRNFSMLSLCCALHTWFRGGLTACFIPWISVTIKKPDIL